MSYSIATIGSLTDAPLPPLTIDPSWIPPGVVVPPGIVTPVAPSPPSVSHESERTTGLVLVAVAGAVVGGLFVLAAFRR